jgi:hypothetical protein
MTSTLVRRLRQWLLAIMQRPRAIPALVLAAYLPFALLHTAATTTTTNMTIPTIQTRPLGDPARAITRIRDENFTTLESLDTLVQNPDISDMERAVYQHAPLLLARPTELSTRDDTIIGVYYTITEGRVGDTTGATIRYYAYFTDENGGTPLKERMPLYGQPIDGELIYKVMLLNNEVTAAYYQAPSHRITRFDYDGSTRPVFAIASANHHFRRVQQRELEHTSATLLAPRPHEKTNAIFSDPDFLALAGREVSQQWGVDISRYVYVTFYNPYSAGEVALSVRVRGVWYNQFATISGSITTFGNRRVAIPIGFTPLRGDIEELRVVSRADSTEGVRIDSVWVYPALRTQS